MSQGFWLDFVPIAVSTIAATELFLYFPFSKQFRKLSVNAIKALKVLRTSRISDHWKEIAVPHYASVIFLVSGRLFSYLGALGIVFFSTYSLMVYVIFGNFADGFAKASQLRVGGMTVLCSLLYVLIRKRWANG